MGSTLWTEVQREFDHIQRSNSNNKPKIKRRDRQASPAPQKFTAAKMQAIKDEVEAEETGNWSYRPQLEDEHIMADDEFPFTTKIREEIAAAVKQADNTIKAMKKIKKQTEITKTKDNLAAKQKQLSDMNKPVS